MRLAHFHSCRTNRITTDSLPFPATSSGNVGRHLNVESAVRLTTAVWQWSCMKLHGITPFEIFGQNSFKLLIHDHCWTGSARSSRNDGFRSERRTWWKKKRYCVKCRPLWRTAVRGALVSVSRLIHAGQPSKRDHRQVGNLPRARKIECLPMINIIPPWPNPWSQHSEPNFTIHDLVA